MTFSQLMRAARFPLMAEGDPSAGGGDPAPAAPAAAPATTTLTSDPAPAAPVAPPEGETPEAKTAREAAEKTAKDSAQGAPEAYGNFTVPEGIELDPAAMTEFHAVAKDLGLNQVQAQKLIDLQSKLAVGQTTAQAEAMKTAFEKQNSDWVERAKADPDIGGDKWDASVASAVKAVQQFGDPELREFLNTSGLGNHPLMIKAFTKIGQALSEDKMVLPGNAGGDAPKKSPEQILWPTTAN